MQVEGRTEGDERLAEARRRAEILRRYVAIERPTAADDEAFASEIGVTANTLVRLASAWRRHGNATLVQGSQYRPSEADRRSALDALRREIDLRGVPASRREEVGRRLAAIRRFLETGEFRLEHWTRAAAELGITDRQFAKLVRAWIMHRMPEMVPGAHAAKRKRRKNTVAFDTTSAQVRRALDELGDAATLARLHRRVEELCLEAGIPPASRTTTYEHARRLRGRSPRKN